MMSVATSEESERRLTEAMRAHASGVGHPGFVGHRGGSPVAHSDAPAPAATPARSGFLAELARSRVPLLLALLSGIVLGVALAVLSLLTTGVLPALG
jgi:hypothetical protein